jgi:tetratricopeptide (TPR) repeat protein
LIFLHVGLLNEAESGLKEALTIQPDDPFTLNFLGQVHEVAGDYEQAGQYQVRALSIDPSHIFAILFQPTALIHQGQLDRAEECVQSAKKLLGQDKMLLSSEALIWARRGEAKKAEEIVRTALQAGKTRAHTHHTWHLAAAVFALLERPGEAVAWLEKASRNGLPNYPLFQGDQHLLSLRGNSAFEKLMSSVQQECEAYRREFVSR